MVRRRRYELLIVLEATSDQAANAASDAAWYAVEDATGSSVVEAVVHERLPDGSLREPGWSGWDEEASVAIRVQYFEP